ncbi:hypothetical protein MPSEU_000585000 [Mayamaea pseudoterrestris]|nr:hypothetical protein MPSEU_000585000 [Mayamaea pseudoterrestris]
MRISIARLVGSVIGLACYAQAFSVAGTVPSVASSLRRDDAHAFSSNPCQHGYSSQTKLCAKKTDLKNNFANDESMTSAAVVARPDPSILLSARDDSTQQLGFAAICGSIAIGTLIVIQFLTAVEEFLPNGWFATWRDYTWAVPLGLIYAAAGVSHFALKESFIAFVPPLGTWGGLWQIPAPGSEQLKLTYEEYHCYWTGVAEILGGLGLMASALHLVPLDVRVPAFCVGLLTAAVTPANIYMATHDVQPPNFPPVPYPSGHVARGVLQCVLLGVFYKLTFQ